MTEKHRDKPSLCIVAHNAYGAMSGGYRGHVGGVERQTTITARWLAAKGYETSLITWDEGQPDGVVIDGVSIFRMCRNAAGVPGVRFIYPRMTSMYRAMAMANADIYYHNCAEYVTGLAALWCRVRRRKFVYSSAHDLDCDAKLPLLRKWYERILYRYGLSHADRLIVQTSHQKQLLKDAFGFDSVALPMPCPGPLPHQFQAPQFPENPRVLWVGRVEPQKRLEWLLDIAERLPAVTFDVAAANMTNKSYATALCQRAKSLPNVNWLGAVPREGMPDLYQRALCLCCTSVHEGFPNTFLEAWSYGKPIVTTFDPDSLISKHDLGIVVRDVEAGVKAVRELLASPDRWRAMTRHARDYYVENHLVDTAMSRFEEEFLAVWTGAQRKTETLLSKRAAP